MVVCGESNYADKESWQLVGVVAIFDRTDGAGTKSEVFTDHMKTERAWRVARELRRLAERAESKGQLSE